MTTVASGLSPEWLAWPQTQVLVRAFASHGDSLRFVGGAVRDALLGYPVVDVDAATTHTPEVTMALLQQAGIRAIPTGLAHGTVTAVIDDRSFEITTLRKDKSCDGRHAQVEYTDNWQLDAQRRDFTMNALYLTPQGTLYDYTGGAEDAKAGNLRFIGDAAERIAEDRLRILRFFRFYARYGKLPPDTKALAACRAASPGIKQLSGERVQKELLRLLATPGAHRTLALMQPDGVLENALGFATGDLGAFARLEAIAAGAGQVVDPHVMLVLFAIGASLPEEEACDHMVGRLRLSNAHAHELVAIVRRRVDTHPGLTQSRQKQLLRQLGRRLFTCVVMVNWATGGDALAPSHPYAAMLKLADEWSPPLFPVTGRDLLEAGIKPGKDMGLLLARLENEWEDSGYILTRTQLLARL